MYKTRGIMTYAQHNVVQKMGRDSYYNNKMLEKFKVIDQDLKQRKQVSFHRRHELAAANIILAKDRSTEQVRMAQTIRMKDQQNVIADKIAAENILLKEKRKAEERRMGYQKMIKEYLRDKQMHQEMQSNGLQPLELKLNKQRLTSIGLLDSVRVVPKK